VDACLPSIPLAFPSCYFVRQSALAVQPTVQALAVHNVDLRFCHVQPTAVFGCVMELELLQNPPSFLGRECLIQARAVVRVQVVLDQPDLLGTGIMDVHQLPHACGIVPSGTLFRHLAMTPAGIVKLM
jgi:hypothetical protein